MTDYIFKAAGVNFSHDTGILFFFFVTAWVSVSKGYSHVDFFFLDEGLWVACALVCNVNVDSFIP